MAPHPPCSRSESRQQRCPWGANKGSTTTTTTTTSQAADNIAIVSFDAGIVSPRDPQSGLPTGRRIHKPITVVKEVDTSSPKLFQSMSTNEVFPSMVLGQAEAGVTGGTITVTLKNARISAITPIVPDAQHPELDKLRRYESISLVFERMDVQHAPSGKLESFTY